MIVLADKSRKAELMEIWKQSFGDSEEYIQMFFEWNLSKTMVMVYEVNGKAVSVAYFLPVTYRKNGEKPVSCRYLYAAATLPGFRGHGYFGEIMKVVRETLPEPVFLVPGEASLVSYYEKQGMQIWTESQSLEMSFDYKVISTFGEDGNKAVRENESNEVYLRDLSTAEYIERRESALSKSTHIDWDEHFMEYICHENIVCGGFQKEISVNGQKYITMYRIEGDVLKILELLSKTNFMELADQESDADVELCIQLLLKESGCKKAGVCLQPTVMMLDKSGLCNEKGYFNLTLG